MFERTALPLAIGIATLALAGGIIFATRLHEPEWVNRSGAIIVCAEAFIAITEHRLKRRLSRISDKEKSNNPQIGKVAEEAEAKLFLVATSLAVLGEALHGFGDLLFKQFLTYID